MTIRRAASTLAWCAGLAAAGQLLVNVAAEARPGARSQSPATFSDVVPSDWMVRASDPASQGRRFVSPDGSASLTLDRTPANAAVEQHLQSVALRPGEDITYLRRGRSWVVASGYREGRIFYRMAVLACGGRAWHQLSYDYPRSSKAMMDRYVTRAAGAALRSQLEGCRALASTP